jgi:hypothetical protein
MRGYPLRRGLRIARAIVLSYTSRETRTVFFFVSELGEHESLYEVNRDSIACSWTLHHQATLTLDSGQKGLTVDRSP